MPTLPLRLKMLVLAVAAVAAGGVSLIGAPSTSAAVAAGPAPAISVSNVPEPGTIEEPGGTVVHTVVVTNSGPDVLLIKSFVDDLYGDLRFSPSTTCQSFPVLLIPGGNYQCTFSVSVQGLPGDSVTDTLTVTAEALTSTGQTIGSETATATATVRVRAAPPPSITTQNIVDPTTPYSPRASIHHTVVVTNTGKGAVRLLNLLDDLYGNLNVYPEGSCQGLPEILPGASYRCFFSALVSGQGGSSVTDSLTATVANSGGIEATASATATVTFVSAPISVTNLVGLSRSAASGALVTHKLAITNTGAVPVRIERLVDDQYGHLERLPGSDCAVLEVIEPGATYSCTFQGSVQGSVGGKFTDTVTVLVEDEAGLFAYGDATATVTIVDGAPPPPSGVGDTYATVAGATIRVPAPGVLANDRDLPPDATALLRTGANSGAVTLGSDGSLTYTPDAGFEGTDRFTYCVSTNGTTCASLPTTVVITVSASGNIEPVSPTTPMARSIPPSPSPSSTSPGAGTSAAPPTGAVLARTGIDLGEGVVAGAVLVLAGAACLVGARSPDRRRRWPCRPAAHRATE